MTDENMELILKRVSEKIQELKLEHKEEVKTDINELDKRLNERFFQLSKETLGFAMNAIAIAAVVAVSVSLAEELLILVSKY